MSKIQEALRRIQGNSLPFGNAPNTATGAESLQVARIKADGVTGKNWGDKNESGLVAEVDQEVLRDAGLIAPEYHEQLLADQYRDIKRPLIANAYGKRVAKVEDGNLIMVTSALPGEGKTFTTVNLAISLAQEQDLTVLLVDADVAKPHVSSVFGLSKLPGLLDFLDGSQQRLNPLIVPTNMQGLSVLPAGAPRSNATELLSSSRMEKLVRQLIADLPRCIMLFDTPPLLRTSESKVLTHMAGQIVLVVKAGSTSQAAVAESLRILGDVKAINLVLNQTPQAETTQQYGYGYGYGLMETT